MSNYTSLLMHRELTLILLVTLASLTTESWSAATSTASVAAPAKPSEENGYDTIRAAAHKIILKIDSIRLGTYQPLSAMHSGAIESLKTISVMDYEVPGKRRLGARVTEQSNSLQRICGGIERSAIRRR